MKYFLLIIVFLTVNLFSQNQINSAAAVYDVIPGTKGNEIVLSLSNISENLDAENLQIRLIKYSSDLSFNKEDDIINLINPKAETDALFKFDIKRETEVNKKDTVIFMITGKKGINIRKEFVLNYTAPKEYQLEQNFPNPFNPSTTIQYQLPFDSKISLKVYDILGNEVTTLVEEAQPAGYKEFKFNASHLASGVYIFRIYAEGIMQPGKYFSVKKMMLLK